MKEKLTKEAVSKLVRTAAWASLHEGAMTELWELIEADREAVRDETLAEVLKDHFKIGEVVISNVDGTDLPAFVSLNVFPVGTKLGTYSCAGLVHRPPKKRPATDGEMLSRLVFRLETWDAVEKALRTDGRTLEELCVSQGISTEVDE